MNNSIIMTEEQIKKIVELQAIEINKIYLKKNIRDICFIYLLNGAFTFAADLARELNKLGMNLMVGPIRIKTYVGTKSISKHPPIYPTFDFSLKDKHILVVDDILDSGYTLDYLSIALQAQNPKSIQICCFAAKKDNKGELLSKLIKPDYIGLTIPDIYIIGYGMDYNDKYRDLPYIKILEDDEK